MSLTLAQLKGYHLLPRLSAKQRKKGSSTLGSSMAARALIVASPSWGFARWAQGQLRDSAAEGCPSFPLVTTGSCQTAPQGGLSRGWSPSAGAAFKPKPQRSASPEVRPHPRGSHVPTRARPPAPLSRTQAPAQRLTDFPPWPGDRWLRLTPPPDLVLTRLTDSCSRLALGPASSPRACPMTRAPAVPAAAPAGPRLAEPLPQGPAGRPGPQLPDPQGAADPRCALARAFGTRRDLLPSIDTWSTLSFLIFRILLLPKKYLQLSWLKSVLNTVTRRSSLPSDQRGRKIWYLKSPRNLRRWNYFTASRTTKSAADGSRMKDSQTLKQLKF